MKWYSRLLLNAVNPYFYPRSIHTLRTSACNVTIIDPNPKIFRNQTGNHLAPLFSIIFKLYSVLQLFIFLWFEIGRKGVSDSISPFW